LLDGVSRAAESARLGDYRMHNGNNAKAIPAHNSNARMHDRPLGMAVEPQPGKR
jgi:hypothetical protein